MASVLAATVLSACAADLDMREEPDELSQTGPFDPDEFDDPKVFNRYYGFPPEWEEELAEEKLEEAGRQGDFEREMNFDDGTIFTRLVPPGIGREIPVQCNNKRVLRQIVDRFAWAENETWHRGFVIARIEAPRVRFVELEEDVGTIPRRYCLARAVMTNGRVHPLFYRTEEEMGFASIGDGVSFCLLGLDPWRVYDAACRVLRPPLERSLVLYELDQVEGFAYRFD